MTPAAKARVRDALRHIEAAQLELHRAMDSLSPVVGLVEEHERVGDLYDKVKAEWYRLDGLDGPFRLDSEPRP